MKWERIVEFRDVSRLDGFRGSGKNGLVRKNAMRDLRTEKNPHLCNLRRSLVGWFSGLGENWLTTEKMNEEKKSTSSIFAGHALDGFREFGKNPRRLMSTATNW